MSQNEIFSKVLAIQSLPDDDKYSHLCEIILEIQEDDFNQYFMYIFEKEAELLAYPMNCELYQFMGVQFKEYENDANIYQAQIFLKNNDIDKAIDRFELIFKRTKSHLLMRYFHIIISSYQLGKYSYSTEGLMALLGVLIKYACNDISLGTFINIMWQDCHEHEKSLRLYEQAIREYDGSLDLRCDFANFLWIAKIDNSRADDLYLSVIKEAPESGLYHGNYAQFLCHQDRLHEASKHIDITLDSNAGNLSLLAEIHLFCYAFLFSKYPSALERYLEIVMDDDFQKASFPSFSVLHEKAVEAAPQQIMLASKLARMAQTS